MTINNKSIRISHNLAILSISLWFISLAFNGLVVGYDASKEVIGIEILATGWLSPLVLNFAWFANPFLISAFFKLTSGKQAALSASIAAILSLNMFLMNGYPVSESGHTSVIYGYGWGAILWIISVFVMLIAAGIRSERAQEDPGISAYGLIMKVAGFVLLTITVLLTSYFSIHDRSVANKDEVINLTKVVFKRGSVCSVEEPSVVEPIKNFSGKLLVRSTGEILAARYPLFQAKDLVAWGVPYAVVTGSGSHGDRNDILSGEDKSDAVLNVHEEYSKLIRVSLVEDKTGRVVFDFTWIRESYPVNKNHYCPDYKSFPKDNEQPRKLLMQGLGLAD